MQLGFVKMQGAGNEILVVDARDSGQQPPSSNVIQQLGDATSGPGFDQLMWLGPAANPDSAASYRVFNADGSEVEQCGNGVRCIAWLLFQQDDIRNLTFESPAGPIETRVLDDDQVAVNMGPPNFEPDRIPFVADGQADQYDIDVDGQIVTAAVLSMGNPHCVLEVDDVGAAPVAQLGPSLERHERFPAGANVGFMHICDRQLIDLRVFERGVGETLACGTGTCAAVVAGQLRGSLDSPVTARLPGGQLMVSWAGGAAPVWLTGSAEWIGEGTIEL